MKPADSTTRLVHATSATRVAALGELRAVAAAYGATHVWDLLVRTAHLESDAGATFVVVAGLVRAFDCGLTATVDMPPSQHLVARALTALHAHCLANNLEQRFGNRFANTNHLSAAKDDHWLLATLATPPMGEFAARVAALHYLVALAVLGDLPRMSAARRVADAARMSRTIITWSELLRELPDPAAHRAEWPGQFATWAQQRMSHRGEDQQPPAILAFCRALLALLDLTRRDIVIPRPQASLLSDAQDDVDGVGRVHIVSSPRSRIGPRAARLERRDDDEHPQLALAYFEDADEQRQAGQEPMSLPLHVRDDVPAGECADAPAAQEQDKRLASYQLAEIEQRLRWSWDHMNSHELRLVVKAVRAQLKAHAFDAPTLLVATVLATGTPVEDVVTMAIAPPPGHPGLDAAGRWIRFVPRPDRAWTPGAEVGALLQPHSETLTLDLEPFLARAWAGLVSARPGCRTVGQALEIDAEEAVKRLSDWLSPLRDQAPWARLTRGRMWRALNVEMGALIGNDAAVHFVVGKARDVAPTSAYYTAVPQERLESAYREASARLFAPDGDHAPRPEGIAFADSPLVGSCKAPDTLWLREQIRAITEAAASCGPQDLHTAHNRYTAHALWLLMFATGHRPVTHPIESLDVVDHRGGWLSISDKSVRTPGETRIVPLCNLATQTLAAYLEHLDRLAALVRDRDEALCRDILSVTADRGPRALPLFFLLDGDLSPQFIAETELIAMAPGLAPLQANLARHLLSSGEAALGDMADLVREMLGHVQHGQPVFGPQSPLSCADYEPLRRWLDGHLRGLGWRVIDSPLPRPPRAWQRPAAATRGITLGQEQRRRSAERSLQRARESLREALRSSLTRKPLRLIGQADVDAVFAALLRGRKAPASMSELEACRRAYRLLAWCQHRYNLEIRLPKVFLPLPPAGASFDPGSLARAKAARELPAEFDRVLVARARDLRHPQAAPSRQVAEAVVSLIVHSRVADYQRVAGLFDGGHFHLVDDGPAGTWVRLTHSGAEIADDESMHCRYALHPVTAALLARLHVCRSASPDAQGRHKQLLSLIEHLRAHVDPGALALGSTTASLRWLCDQIAALNALELHGTVAGYLNGNTGAVSLPPGDWARLVVGRRLRPAVGQSHDAQAVGGFPEQTRPGADGRGGEESETEPVCATESANAASIPLPALQPCRDDAVHGQALARVRSLHKQVNDLLHRHVRSLGVGRSRANQSLSRNQKELLIPALEDLCRRFADVPVLARAGAQWLQHLLLHGIGGKELRARSCMRYYYSLAPRLPLALAVLDVADLDADTLAQAYGQFIDLLGPTSQAYAFRRLQVFHQFLMEHHGVPPVEWAEVAPTTLLPNLRVDASIITWPEHHAIVELLAEDRYADERTQVLQSVVWIIVFRFGARINEVLGLRRRDVVWTENELVILFRPNAYRELKSSAAVRQVPLIGPLSDLERRLLESWLKHMDHYVSVDRMAALFGERGEARDLVDTRSIRSRITQALHAVTGDEHLRIHSGRHAFACRLQLLMQVEDSKPPQRFGMLVARILGPTDPAQVRQLLTDTPGRSRRGLWAAKLAMGHASPLTMQRCYCHLDDLLSAQALGPVFDRYPARMNRRTLAYVSGCMAADLAQAVDHREVPLTLGRVLGLNPMAWTRSSELVVDRVDQPRLPPRAELAVAPMTAALADQALGFVHRRGELDGAHHTLLMPARQLRALFMAEHAVRVAAGYDVAGARWPATTTSGALKHVRSGQRSAAETARVQPFLRSMDTKLADDGFAADTHRVCELWQERYRHDCTPIVLASAQECEVLVRWLNAVGLSLSALELRVSDAEQAAGLHSLVERFKPLAVKLGSVPSPRSRLRRSQAAGIGLVLLENSTEKLTQMSQLHRVLHVLSSLNGMGQWMVTSALSDSPQVG